MAAALEQQQPLRTGKAWLQVKAGEPSDGNLLKIVERAVPATLREGQLLVKVASAALNPVDYKICEGKIPSGTFPLYPGCDFAGEVCQVSAGSGFEVGQEVFGDSPNSSEKNPSGGTLSEYVVVNKSQVALKPASLAFVEASGLPLVGQTVLDCITRAEVGRGARVLILGASGGVGTVAVQICKARGYHVVGVCSDKNVGLVKSLGADEVVDYKQHDWATYLKDDKVEIVFDFAPSSAASTQSWDKAKQVMNRGGKFITISGPDPEGRVSVPSFFKLTLQMWCINCCSGFKYHIVLKATTAAKLQELAKLVEEKKLKPVIDKVYKFTEVNVAFAQLMSGRATGKICITVPN